MHEHKPSQTAARDPDLARDNFEFEKHFAIKCKNLNKTAKYLSGKFYFCKIVSSRLNF
jgi:hypothetical protein